MLKQLLFSGCVTGLVGLSLIQSADSQTTSTSPVKLTFFIEPARVSPTSLPDPTNPSANPSAATVPQTPVQPVQSVPVIQATSPTTVPITQSSGPVASVSVPPLPIRALVASNSANLSVATPTDASVLDANGAALATLPQEVEYQINRTMRALPSVISSFRRWYRLLRMRMA